jgi:hypothetical protein
MKCFFGKKNKSNNTSLAKTNNTLFDFAQILAIVVAVELELKVFFT